MNIHTSPRIEFVIQCLRDAMPKRWQEIAKSTGVPEDTIRKIAYRETKNPRSITLDALHAHFEAAMKATHSRRTAARRTESRRSETDQRIAERRAQDRRNSSTEKT